MSGWSKSSKLHPRLAWPALFLPALLLFAAPGSAQEPTAPAAPAPIRIRVNLVSVGAIVTGHAQEPAAPAPPAPIRIRVNLVSVGTIVTDDKGNFVDGLRKHDFRVLDNGVEQPLTHFAAVEDPAQVLLLVESGPAVYLLESGHLQAAYALLNGLSPDDRVAVAGYAERPQMLLDFTTDKTAAAAALGKLRFILGFGQLNLSSSLNEVLDRLAPAIGKKTIVLLSTGVDTSPENIAEDLLARLRTGDVRVLGVALGAELRESKPKGKQKVSPEKVAAAEEGFAQADAWMKAITEASGGRVYFPKNAREFAAAYAEIAQIVRHEYSLGFAPSQHDGKLHQIDVRVQLAPASGNSQSHPSMYRTDHRQAYLAPPPDAN